MMDLPEGQEWVFDMVNNILIEVLGTIAEQERETIRKRQTEGIEAAKAKEKSSEDPHWHFQQTGTGFMPPGKLARSPPRPLWK